MFRYRCSNLGAGKAG